MHAGPSSKEQGLSALRQGDVASASRFLAEAVRLDAGDAEAWSGLGVAHCQLGQTGEGIAALRRAVALRPDAAPLHFNLGRALELQGLSLEALSCFQHTLQLDPGHLGATEALKRVGAASVPVSPPALGDFALSSPAAGIPSLPAAPPVPLGFPSTPVRPVYSTPYPGAPQPPPLGSYSQPNSRTYAGPSGPPRGARPANSGMSPWTILGIVAAVLFVVGGGVVVVLAAILFPAVQRAREAAQEARRREQQRARPGIPGSYSSPPTYSPGITPPTFGSNPQYRPRSMPEFPRTRIVIPPTPRIEIPDPPRYTPPPIPEPPRFIPHSIPEPPRFTPRSMPEMPSLPSAPPQRMLYPRSFPTPSGPRFRFAPPGSMPGGSSIPTPEATPTSPPGSAEPAPTPAPGNE